jgi:hypothetical protein
MCRAEGEQYRPLKGLLPVFSQSKINECHADITNPTLYGLDNLLTDVQEREIPPWHERNDTLFFRGATTGRFQTLHGPALGVSLQCYVPNAVC